MIMGFALVGTYKSNALGLSKRASKEICLQFFFVLGALALSFEISKLC